MATSGGDEGDTWEGILEAEVPLGIGMGKSVELFLVAFHLLNEVDEMERFLELLEVLGVNHVAKLILNADDKLDDIEGVETVGGEDGVQSNGGLLGRAEVILGDGDHVLLNLVVTLEDKGILGGINLGLPQLDCTDSWFFLSTGKKGVLIKTEFLEVGHSLGGEDHNWLAHHCATSLFEGSKSESGQHF